ncbi:hypothetical protein [Elongatibacter sediminis]|uniref:Uncharacterized protein n=1 Tax=Elongatibacter sediminis TaxID=3119006 RepID=A0AAW9R9V8_9GAMM
MKELNDVQRTRLAALADVLMPAGAGLPAASEVDVHLTWMDQALDAVPTMAPAILAALEVSGEPAEVVETLREESPDLFMALTFVLSGAYFMHPRVRQALGYEGLAVEPNPPLEGEAEYYLEDDLLQPVLERGPIYRQVPEEANNAGGTS